LREAILKKKRDGKRGTSHYIGVHWYELHGLWKASIHHGGRVYQLGRFETAREAAIACAADVPAGKTTYATVDEWYAACSVGGTQRYSYGNVYQSTFATWTRTARPAQSELVLPPPVTRRIHRTPNLEDMNGNSRSGRRRAALRPACRTPASCAGAHG
jgi:hypothetical protein